MQLFPVGKIFDFMKNRRWFIGVSLFLVLSFARPARVPGPPARHRLPGRHRDRGGVHQSRDGAAIRNAVTASGFSRPDVIRVNDTNNKNRYLIRVQDVSTISEAKQTEIERAAVLRREPRRRRSVRRTAAPTRSSSAPAATRSPFASTPLRTSSGSRRRWSGIGNVELREGKNNPTLQNVRDHKVEIQLKSKGDQLMDALRRTARQGHRAGDRAARGVDRTQGGRQLRDAALQSIAIALVFIMATSRSASTCASRRARSSP